MIRKKHRCTLIYTQGNLMGVGRAHYHSPCLQLYHSHASTLLTSVTSLLKLQLHYRKSSEKTQIIGLRSGKKHRYVLYIQAGVYFLIRILCLYLTGEVIWKIGVNYFNGIQGLKGKQLSGKNNKIMP